MKVPIRHGLSRNSPRRRIALLHGTPWATRLTIFGVFLSAWRIPAIL
ncbi:hypothetical protein NSU_3973 [Novosphingobium pentaromativorans US6-1]|uniref:Uncharacterized protein n=1 Tax=Novosphingobium pentaromativorans US6-1 TaxID=1088721 RepID=G6EI01_9SPHN|nr:hypothetical protein NSU_3973 [Novosphingobium pentaromativorans US6-1]